MIKSFAATTREIDDADAAVNEILTALNLEKNLLSHSIGIISCFSEFDDTGALKAVCDALPFDCIGATTCICAADKEVDTVILSVTVLTSDDCRFETAMIPVKGDYDAALGLAASDLLARCEHKPGLLLSYFPLINEISGDMMLTSVDKATGGIPLFGTTAVDHMMDYSTAKTIYNGEAFREAVVLGAICGPVDFTFELASLDEKKIRRQKAIITESSGNILIGVNGKSALDYLIEIGLSKAALATGLGIVPLVVDHKDGTKPVARAVFALTPEGHAVCGGAMPEGTTLSVAQVDMTDVLSTTEHTLKDILMHDGAILSYSCMARYLALGASSTAEAEKFSELSYDRPHLFACSGGEICPLPDAEGRLKNYYHNYTIAFCRLS